MRRITLLWALALLAGCEDQEPLADWSLVGVYDASALVQAGLVGQEEGAGGAQFVWVSPGGMRKSCGPAKAPDGLGLFEAEAMANRLTPTLAILLERNGEGDAAMTPDDVKVSLGMPDPETGAMKPSFALHPAVMPRYTSVRIEGDAETRHKQVVRNQLVMELCMEHKTGRGWIGGDRTQLREAFLLDPPADGAAADRKFFGGQRDPVPALLGPPDACMQQVIEDSAAEKAAKDGGGGRGDGSLALVPSDVWGASLRQCGPEEVQGSEYTGNKAIPLTLGDTNEQPNRKIPAQWTELVATLKHADADMDVKIDLTWGDQKLLVDEALMKQPVDDEGNPVGLPGVSDLLQRVPHTYPLVGTTAERGRYTVLLVPNWQIVEGLRRIDAGKPKEPLKYPGDGVQDGVGFIIDNPEYLFVLLEPRRAEPAEPVDPDAPPAPVELDEHGKPKAESWPNVAEPLAGGPLGLMRWGYSPGMLSGRAPIALPGHDEPTWEQVKQAHNAELHASFLLAAVVLGGLAFLGMQRLRDLWANLPEERVDFWPVGDGLPPEKDEAPAPKVPEAGG